MKQFSKRMIKWLFIAWFIGMGFGVIYTSVQLFIAPESASIDGLLTYIGAPMSCGIVSYSAKAAFENKEKIKQNYINDYDGGCNNE